MAHDHLSPIQKDDIHPDILTKKMLEDLRKACGAEQLIVMASKNNVTDVRAFGMCGHEIINAARGVIEFGLDSLEEETEEEI